LIAKELKYNFTRMEILQNIAELVQSQREVGVTGLGTIFKKKSPGRYDAATRSFLPPSYTIAFKNEVSEQGSLANRLALQENISKEAANDGIAQFADRIKKELAASGQANFQPLGTLKTENGNIHLDVQQDFNSGLEFFGLPKVENEPEPINQVEEVNSFLDYQEPEKVQPLLEPVSEPAAIDPPPVQRDEPATYQPEEIEENLGEVPEETPIRRSVTDAEIAEVKVDPVEQEIIIDNLLEEENPGNETHEPQLIEVQKAPLEDSIKYTIDEQPAGQKSDPLMLKVVLTLLVLIVLGVIAYLLYPRTDEPARKPAVVAVDSTKLRTDSLQKATDLKAAQDSAALQDSLLKAKPNAAKVILPDTLNKVAADTTNTYEIIGASVLNQKEADWFITQMKRNGIKAKVVRNIPGKRLKMSIATVGDINTAKMERDRLRKKLDIKGIYIYKNKKE
jgi:hypothetical protein